MSLTIYLANVNSEAFKRQLNLEAFREGEHLHSDAPVNVFHGVNQGDTKPKRQWRSPRKISSLIPDQALKNMDRFSANSDEKLKAEERTKMQLARLYVASAIPDSPSEPDIRAPVPSRDKVKIIPQLTEEQEMKPDIKPQLDLEDLNKPVMDLSSVNLNFDINTIRAAVSTANSSNHQSYP